MDDDPFVERPARRDLYDSSRGDEDFSGDELAPLRPVASAPATEDSLGGLASVIPILQVLLLVMSIAMILLLPPLWSIAAWILAAFLVPQLWAWYYVQDRQQQIATELVPVKDMRRRWNQWLLYVGLGVGIWASWVFATELAK